MIDIVILFILVGMGWYSGAVGFVRSIYNMLTSVLALVIAFLLYPMTSIILKLTPLYNGVLNWNTKKVLAVNDVLGLQSQGKLIEEATAWLPSYIGKSMVENNNPEVYKLLGVANVMEYVATYITDFCISALAVAVVWVVAKLFLRSIGRALDLVSKLPLISTINTWAGFALGVVKGVFCLWLIQLVLPFMLLIPSLAFLGPLLEESMLYPILGDVNIVLQYMNEMFVKRSIG